MEIEDQRCTVKHRVTTLGDIPINTLFFWRDSKLPWLRVWGNRIVALDGSSSLHGAHECIQKYQPVQARLVIEKDLQGEQKDVVDD